MTRSEHYRRQWECHRELFGWGQDAQYWGLPPWTPELAALMARVLGGETVASPWGVRGMVRAAVAGWLATREPRYAQAARTLFEAEILTAETANFSLPSLTQGVLLQGWLNGLGWMLDSPEFDSAFWERLLAGVVRLTERLAGRLCPASMNWRVADAANLLKASLLLDEEPQALQWRGLAVRALNDAVHRQINADGSHRERNPHYHNWMALELTTLWRLARALPDLGLRIPAPRLAAMWDYAVFCNRPNGTENGLHDSRGWFSGCRPDAEQRERARFLSEAGSPTVLPSPCGWFPDAGQALLRDSWDPDAVYVTFDATRWGEGHCHYSRNSLQLHAYGRTLLADPGVFEYKDSPLGNYGRSTRAHSTLNLNGWNQAQTNPARMEGSHADGYDLVLADYDGTYHPGEMSMVHAGTLGPGLWASHHRCLLWIHGRALIVIDSFVRVPDRDEGLDQAPRLENNWQLGPGAAHWDPATRRLVTSQPDANLLMLFPAVPEGTTGSVHTGEMAPPRGFVSVLYSEHGEDVPNCGRATPAPQLCLALAPMRGARAEFVTVLVPFRGTAVPELQATARPATLTVPGYVHLAWADGRTDDVTWSYRLDLGLGQRDAYDTDAALVHIARESSGAVHGLAAAATYIHPFRPGAVSAVPGMLCF